MTNQKTKLELTWIGKENRPRLEPRILIEEPGKSYHASHRISGKDIFDNRLIFGDNLLALKALEQEFSGQIKCVYIDPPYNTGSAFAQYDDGTEHSVWLSLMRDRLELFKRLLHPEQGALFISIDDNEGHYLKVLCDEVFGRANFVCTIVWHKRHSRSNDAKWFSDNHDFILAYAMNKQVWRPNLLPRKQEQDEAYSNPDNDPRGPWMSQPIQVKTPSDAYIYEIVTTGGRKVWPPKGRSWQFGKERYEELVRDNRIYLGSDGTNVPRIKKFLSEVKDGIVPLTLWPREEVGDNQEAKNESKALFPEEPFGTPKPERLIERILTLSTKPGDIVLDSFAGSGTTGAVAHKMGRKWIMCELGEHCHTHIIPRLQKVVDGKDPGGITEAAEWKGGGGFRYYRLAPSLLERDAFDQWVINKKYNPNMLAEAICKLEGFTYAPSETAYWQHGRSTESDFIYITTQTLTRDQLQRLSDEVGENRTLLIMCGAFRIKNPAEFQNLTLKKIPNAVLRKCEWGRDDYSLEIKDLPQKPEEEAVAQSKTKPRSKAERRDQATLFELPSPEGGAL